MASSPVPVYSTKVIQTPFAANLDPHFIVNEFIVKSTLVEQPPENNDSDAASQTSVEFIRAGSVQELAKQTSLESDEVLDRVLLPGKRFGSYHILGFIAAGGMGEIYAAERIFDDGRRSRPLALKVITAEYANDWRIIERFKREARISKAIRSRHVTRVYEFGESPQGDVFLAMELLDGEELFDRLCHQRYLSPMEMGELSLQILKGLHKIHDSGFVHRDIKPENIFLAKTPEGDESVKILDFGIAKRADEESDPLLSVAGQIYGTPQYIAPEQAINPDVDHRADLYSLGVLLYECVTGSLPFDGESSYDVIVAHQKSPLPPLPSSVDPAFGDIIHRALAKDPDERFQSAVEMGRVIKRWIDETSWVEDDGAPITGDMPLLDTHEASADAHDAATVAGDDSQQLAAELATPTPAPDSGAMDNPFLSEDVPAVEPSAAKPSAPERPASQPAPQEPAEPTPAPLTPADHTPTDQRPAEDTEAPLVPPPDRTTEFRSPRDNAQAPPADSSEARTAQIVTGIAMGLIILALLWAFAF